MSQLPTLDDLIRRKRLERDQIARPYQQALAREREILAARTQYWELLDEFMERVRELGLRPQICHSQSPDGSTPRITWVEGYQLTSGAVVSAPPLRYCVAERRRVLRPVPEVCEVEELSLFVVVDGYADSRLPTSALEQQTGSGKPWPRLYRLEETGVELTALRRQLEASLLALMD